MAIGTKGKKPAGRTNSVVLCIIGCESAEADHVFMSSDKTQTEKNIPVHIAIIPDGNRRWAKEKKLPTLEGHRRGALNFEKLLDAAKEKGVKVMTGWYFSTENWERSEEENNYLFDLARKLTEQYKKKVYEEDIRFKHLGRKDRLPKDIVDTLTKLEEDTKDKTSFTVCIGMDYGGQDELMRTFQKLRDKDLEPTKENIEANLDTVDLPMPDMIIRTGGDHRLSGFMSWQSAYAEFFFAPQYFPDFKPELLKEAIDNYGSRERRFGGDSKVYGGGTTK
jgi:undecaprenyl diphosphate synthase